MVHKSHSRKFAFIFLKTFLFGFIAMIFWMAVGLHPFLAMNVPVDAQILVVEGWLPNYALKAAAAEFNKGNYSVLVTTGGPIEGQCTGTRCVTYAE
jgi:hypothetical protein